MQIQIELLVNKQVLGLNNQRIGRIEEIHAELRKGDCYVVEFLIGSYAIFERLSALRLGAAILGVFGSRIRESYAIPWEKLDLSDPSRPRLTCKTNQLRRVDAR